jgi:hypothetical protein
MKPPDFEDNNDLKNHLPDLEELNNMLELKPDGPEKFFLIIILTAKYQACKKLCDLQSQKFIDLIKYGKKFNLNGTSAINHIPSKDFDSAKNKISSVFCAADNLKWKYFFDDKQVFEDFINNFSLFFTNQKYDSALKFNFRPRTKTRLCNSLNEIFTKMGTGPLKKDRSFLNLIRNLSPFNNENLNQIYKDIIRAPLFIFPFLRCFFDLDELFVCWF